MKEQLPLTLLHQIAITLIPGVGDVLAKNLISYCGGVEEVFRTKKSHLLKIPGVGEKVASAVYAFKDFKRAEQELSFIEKHKVKPLFYLEKNYPVRLKQIEDAPVMLYYLGEGDLNNSKIVGIVGTRKASEYGKACVENLVAQLAETGCLILSGLAYGIDIHAHRDALKYKLPTVGVLAHGLDRLYPAQHTATAKKMVEKGGLLTEFISGSNPDRENFPKRNRIVAGLCDVLVVVETAEKGGAMITAELANGYNKDVAAFPGRVNDEYSKGCNKLIKSNKATLITNTDDLYYLMGWNNSKPKPKVQHMLPLDLSVVDTAIYSFIKNKTKAGIDEIAFALQIDAGNLSLQLLEMEFKGLIRTLPGKHYELT
ncbi:MAG: DNA-processing protein DprA [Bacteroidota bacterium]